VDGSPGSGPDRHAGRIRNPEGDALLTLLWLGRKNVEQWAAILPEYFSIKNIQLKSFSSPI